MISKTISVRHALTLTFTGLSLMLSQTMGECAGGLTAREVLKATGIQGGLIVHLGCGDGRFTAALRANERFAVHGLDTNPEHIAAARRYIQSLGLYGDVSVETWKGKLLPYAANLVNLVVAEDLAGITMDEVQRVLVPEGVAYVKSGDHWTKTVKPRSSEIDEWTHYLHDAGNNPVARDTRVGAPRALQWVAPPLWLRSHETPSGFQAMVAGGGRMFYCLDEGLIGITDQRLPERWSLVCRDAFNGKLLWKRPLEKWGWHEWAEFKFSGEDWTSITGGRTVVPDENQRRIVVEGDRLYATLSYRAPLSILDAATGKTIVTVPGTEPVNQIIADRGVAVVYTQAAEAETPKRRGKGKAKRSEEPVGKLVAVRGSTGAVLWRRNIASLHGMFLAIDQGRVICQAADKLLCMNLESGRQLWEVKPQDVRARTLVANSGRVILLGQKTIEVLDAKDGRQVWLKQVSLTGGLGGEDLFVINGVVWPGLLSVDEKGEPSKKSPNALAIGYDLATGEERKRILAENLRSPEHHHRCYRNKATENYIISGLEGAEFFDLAGTDNTQNNFVRGACKLGVMPCNGMLYVPPDQCFCQPGAKLLGLSAIASDNGAVADPVPDAQRLERGPAYGKAAQAGWKSSPALDWPTFRHDTARHGSTPGAVTLPLATSWRARIGGNLTAPVCIGDRVYVASRDAHTLHVLDTKTGRTIWTFVAGGRIDSPPTIERGLVLMGSADGWVYCLRDTDGALVWRFLAAPWDRRIACNDQLESAWPVHGSVLVRDGIAYVTAGRSSYLDGGIRLYALNPETGQIVHQNTLSGPFPDGGKTIPRDVSFFIEGANDDVLSSEGDTIYMRQKRLTLALEEQKPEILSSKGEADVGQHVFSTSGFLDSSWYNRAFWMYTKRWPGFQLANQAPKSGQLLVVDDTRTYAINPFYHRNVHSPMFFPGKEGYLLFADENGNEPQIVGEPGSRTPVVWLPQSDYDRRGGKQPLDSEAFGLDKMIGYTRAEPPVWTTWEKVRMRALVKAGDTLFAAGPPDEFDAKDPYAAFEGRRGARLVALSAKDGQKLVQQSLDAPPVFDGMIAARGRLFISLEDGSLACLTGAN